MYWSLLGAKTTDTKPHNEEAGFDGLVIKVSYFDSGLYPIFYQLSMVSMIFP